LRGRRFASVPVRLNSRENVCYIEPGPEIVFAERSGVRIHATEVVLSVQRTATNRIDLSGIDDGADALNEILDSVDRNRQLQGLCESLLPTRSDIFYDDKEGLQSVKMQITYSVRYVRARQRAK
jgi:hypothetical protein